MTRSPDRRDLPVDNPQKSHYTEIHDDYNRHYFDESSCLYRETFLLNPLVEGLDLRGAHIADLACGAGETSRWMMQRFPGANVTGFDISARACEEYRARLGRPAYELDLTRPMVDVAEQFDVAIVIGGLHHCVLNMDQTLANVHRLVKDGGMLLMVEPNARFALERVRKVWYRIDRYFQADTEAALDHDAILSLAAGRFAADRVTYFGGPAYFIILNSLPLRIPQQWKRPMLRPLAAIERIYNTLPGRQAYPAFLARWRKVAIG